VARRAVRITAVAASAQLGGTERVLLDVAARAFEHDINLRVLTPRDGPLIRILNDLGVPADVVPASARMLAGSQRLGHLWTLPGSVTGLIGWARRLARHSFFRDADAIYTVAFKAHLAVAWLRRHPVVWHLHEYPPAATSILWRLTSRFVPDAMIANSEATARAWTGRRSNDVKREPGTARHEPVSTKRGSPTTPLAFHGSRLTVIPNGVDLDRFRPRPRSYWIHDQLGIPRQHRLIGMPAVFARWKGQMEVIEAFSVVSSQFPDVHLVIVGGSIYDTAAERTYASQLESHVRAGMVSGERYAGGMQPGTKPGGSRSAHLSPLTRIHLLGFQPKIELVYPELDLAVHYSLRPEPFGRVILEAMACGVAVIAAAEGGPVEILGNRATGLPPDRPTARSPHRPENGHRRSPIGHRTPCGWLVPPRHVPALAETLREALSLPRDQLRPLGEAARRRAEDRFSARQFARRVADVLRQAVLGAP